MTDLLKDLRDAEALAAGDRPCALCDHIRAMPPGITRDTLVGAAAGTIGMHKLVRIFQAHDIPVGRKLLERHRKEGHSPA